MTSELTPRERRAAIGSQNLERARAKRSINAMVRRIERLPGPVEPADRDRVIAAAALIPVRK